MSKEPTKKAEENLEFSPYTLKIMDLEFRNEFLNYKREEIRQRTKYILGLNWALCVCVLSAYIAIKLGENED